MMKECIDGMSTSEKPLSSSRLVLSSLGWNATFIGLVSLTLYGLFQLEWAGVWHMAQISASWVYQFIVNQSWTYFTLVLIGCFTSNSVRYSATYTTGEPLPHYRVLAKVSSLMTVFFVMALLVGIIAKIASVN